MPAGHPEERKIAVRAYASSVPSAGGTGTKRTSSKRGGADPGPSSYGLIFDCETTTNDAQQLRVGAYQWRKAGMLKESGLFYDPLSLTVREQTTLARYAERHGLALRTAEEFIEKVFLRKAYRLSALVVGFNLPFDLSRIAIDHWPARDGRSGSMRGGFGLRLSPYPWWPTLQIKHLSATASLIRFTIPKGQDASRSMRRRDRRPAARRGYFVDVHSLSAALIGEKGSLAKVASHLGALHQKTDGEHGTRLSMKYLDYLINDVQVTWECFEMLAGRFNRYGLTQTSINKIFSEASVGKACLKEMGVRTWREVQPDVPPELLGIIMSTYYGGRSEVHVRREVTPIVYCDFTSMYPTVSTLMGLWHFVIAKGIRWEDATEETETFLRSFSLDDLARPDTWQGLAVLVQVVPNEDVFPVRSAYDEKSPAYSIGLNRLTADDGLWFTLADALVSVLLTGKVPKVTKAIRFSPCEEQDELRPLDILGNPDYRVDPAKEDVYNRLVELRSEIKKAARHAVNEEAGARLDAEQTAVKIMANAVCYGIFVELNVTEKARKKKVTYFGSDELAHTTELLSIEEPGSFFHPLLATLTTGAARLMLGIAEALAQREGLTWAFCDTDSMAIARPSGMPEEEFRKRAERVRLWFEQLNPYRSGTQLFKLEDQNFNIADPSSLDTLYCLCISSKRYALFNLSPEGTPIIRKGSAHGLGHLMGPYGDDEAPPSIPAPSVPLEEMGLNRWQYDLWYRIVEASLAGHPSQVQLDDIKGLNKTAISRYAATTPRLLEWFKTHNEGRCYREQVRPFGFLCAFTARGPARCDPYSIELDGKRRGQAAVQVPRAASPYNRDPAIAAKNAFDRETGERVPSGSLKTYREAVAQYHLHPESKFVGGDYLDRGPMARRHVKAKGIDHIGKEANRWEEQFATGEDIDAQIRYGMVGGDDEEVLTGLREECQRYGRRQLARKANLAHKTVSRFMRGAPTTEATLSKLHKALDP